MKTLGAGIDLSCGCCGKYFATWEGYEDQDQDNGYGICRPCQKDAEEENEKQYEKIYKMIIDSLSKEGKKTAMKREQDEGRETARNMVVNWALENNIVTWEIGRV